MGKEFEIVRYRALRHVNIFVNDIVFRNVHFHNEFEIILALEGEGNIFIEGKGYEVRKDDIFVINPNENHEFDNGGSHLVCLIIQVNKRFLNEYVPEINELRFLGNRMPRDERLKREILTAALSFLEKGPLYKIQAVSDIIGILTMLGERNGYELESPADDRRLLRMRRWQDYIEENAAAPISLNDLAKEEELTVTYVSHLFRDYFGITFQEYLNNLRFEKALFLLNSSAMPVYDLALAAGFSDPKYLNEQFHKHFGCSVRSYRKKNTGSSEQKEKRSSLSERIYYDTEALLLLQNYAE